MAEADAKVLSVQSVLSQDQILSIENLDDVITLLERHKFIKTSYYQLGIRLRLSDDILKIIKQDERNTVDCFTECLSKWLRKADFVKEDPTIKILVAALRIMGENAVANGIDKEIDLPETSNRSMESVTHTASPNSKVEQLQQPEVEQPQQPEVEQPQQPEVEQPQQPEVEQPQQPTGVHEIESKIELSELREIAYQLKTKFNHLVLAVKMSLDKNACLKDAILLIKLYLKGKDEVHPQVHLDNLKEVNNFNGLFDFLIDNNFIGYINYKLLKELSKHVSEKDASLMNKVDDYEKKYAELLNEISCKKLVSLFDKWPELSPATPVGLPHVSFELDSRWCFYRFSVWVTTFGKFSWSYLAFLEQLKESCIVVTYAILPYFFDEIERDLKNPVKLKELEAEGVTVIELPQEKDMLVNLKVEENYLNAKADDTDQNGSEHDNYSIDYSILDEYELQRQSIGETLPPWTFTYDEMLRLIRNSSVSMVGCCCTLTGHSFEERAPLLQDFMKNAVKFNDSCSASIEYHKSLKSRCSKEGFPTFKFNVLSKYPFKELMWLPGTRRSTLSLCMLSCILNVLNARSLSLEKVQVRVAENCNNSVTVAHHAQWLFDEITKMLKVLPDQPQRRKLLLAGVAVLNIFNVGHSKAAREFFLFFCHYCERSLLLVFQPAASELHSLVPKERREETVVDCKYNQTLPDNAHLSPDDASHLEHILKAKYDVEGKLHKVDLSSIAGMESTKKKLEDIVVSNMGMYEKDLPMRYVFLFSLLQSLSITLASRSYITELADSIKIDMKGGDIEVFLNLFTSFASLFYVPSLSNVVIVDIEKFTDCVDRLYAETSSGGSSCGFINEEAIDSLAKEEELDSELFKVALQCFCFAVRIKKSQLKSVNFTIQDDYLYYVPSMRCSDTEINDRFSNSLYLKVKPMCMPCNMQVLLLRHIIKKEQFLLIPTLHINATTIGVRFQEICIEVTLIDHGDTIELRLQGNHLPDNYNRACSLLVKACIAAMKDAKKATDGFQYSFAFKCANPESHQYHLLDNKDHCDDCESGANDDRYSAKFRDYWNHAMLMKDEDSEDLLVPNDKAHKEKDAYIAKLMRENIQLREQSKKKDISAEVQDMAIIDKLIDQVGDSRKKLFLVQGNRLQLMDWEEFGLKIYIEKDSLLSSEMSKVAVAALVGGEFAFPKNTVLVSAVYAVTVSKPLLKPLILEIQHCVDLKGRPDLSQYLKFAIAPVSTAASLPYQFSIIEGGNFCSDNCYGSIDYGGNSTLDLVCILGFTEKEEHQQQQEEGEEQRQRQLGEEEQEGQKQQQQRGQEIGEEKLDRTLRTGTSGSNESTGIFEATVYAGLTYYEEKGPEDLVRIISAKKLDALLQFIKEKYPQADAGQTVYFSFKPSCDCIELKFDAPQDRPSTGWKLMHHIAPCMFHFRDIDNYGKKGYSAPPSCLVSVYGSPGAVPSLHYAVPLVGVTDPVKLYIHRELRNQRTLPPSKISDELSEATAGHSDDNVNKLKEVIENVLGHSNDLSNSLPESAISELASQLYTARLINTAVKEAPSMKEFISEFKSGLQSKNKVIDIKEHCQKFLDSFIAVRGSCANAAMALRDDWIVAIERELDFDFDLN